ncbi:MAG TPA: hypothetical protein DCO79_05790, partial [Spirochaeta sp.]|nr:hypothetical protein [Spirochaeta sp.]
MHSLTEKLIHRRKAVLFIGIAITVFWALNMLNIRIDGSFTTVLPETDPDFLFNRTVEEEFGSSDEVIILIQSDETVYSRETAELITVLSNKLAGYDEIDGDKIINMLKVSNFSQPENDGWEKALGDLKEFMVTDPLAAGTVTGTNGKSTMIMAPVSGELS